MADRLAASMGCKGVAMNGDSQPMSSTLAELLRVTARQHGERTALRVLASDSGATVGAVAVELTWAAVDAAVDRVASGLLAAGVAPGDRVALVLSNRPEFVTGYLGISRAGAVAVPLNVLLSAAELGPLMGQAGARVVLTERGSAAAVRAASPQATVLVAGEDSWPGSLGATALAAEGATAPAAEGATAPAAEGATAPGASGPAVPRTADDLAVLLFTAGTTGRPKAAMLSNRNLLANIDQIAALDHAPVRSDDVVLGVLPLVHVFGLNAILGSVVRSGATLVLAARFDAVASLAAVASQRVTVLPVAPPMLAAWLTRPELSRATATVRLVVCGAAPLDPELYRRWAAITAVPLFEGYGLTECSPVVASTMVRGVPKAGSTGRPLPGVTVRVLDAEGDDVDDGDTGELAVAGANVFGGYWPDGEGGQDARGFVLTGDMAYVDNDGDLVLVDRSRDLVVVSGFSVYPREVESVLAAHPQVGDVAVVAIPNVITGESVKAFVVAAAGVTDPDPAELLAWCRQRLARFKCPSVIEVVADLPYSLAGRVNRALLRTRAVGLGAPEAGGLAHGGSGPVGVSS